MKHLFLEILLCFMICTSWNDVGAERIKLLPDSALTRQEKLVVGGRDAVLGEFPFQVSLQVTGYGHICGGIILNEYTVLTAAHCFNNRPSRGQFEIVAGANTLKGPHEEVQNRLIDRLFIHPKYSQQFNGIAAINDIAIIRVRVPFIFNHYVNAARLPKADIYPQGDVQISGWGSISKESSGVSNILRVVDLPLLSSVECEAHVLERQHLKTGDWVKTLVCTKPLSGLATPYKGDSGGPLFQDGVVVGIVSTGETELESTLAIYTRVSAFRQWIDSKMFLPTNSSRKVNNEL